MATGARLVVGGAAVVLLPDARLLLLAAHVGHGRAFVHLRLMVDAAILEAPEIHPRLMASPLKGAVLDVLPTVDGLL